MINYDDPSAVHNALKATLEEYRIKVLASTNANDERVLNEAIAKVRWIVTEVGRNEWKKSGDQALQSFHVSMANLFKAFKVHGMSDDTARLNWMIATGYGGAIPDGVLRARKIVLLMDHVNWPVGVRQAIDDDMKSYKDFGDPVEIPNPPNE